MKMFSMATLPLPNLGSLGFSIAIEELGLPALPNQIPPPKFSDEGYNSLFLESGLSTDIYALFDVLIILAVGSINYLLKRINFKYQKSWEMFHQNMKWGFLLRFLLSNYLPLSIACALQYYSIDFSNSFSTSGFALSVFNVVSLIVFTGFIVNMGRRRDQSILIKKDSKNSIGSLYDDLKHNDSPVIKSFNAIICVRKLCFTGSVVLLYYSVFANLVFLLIQSVGMLIIMIWLRPYKRGIINFINGSQEAVLIVINVVLLVVYDQDFGDDFVTGLGWGLVGVATYQIVLSFGVMMYDAMTEWRKMFRELATNIQGNEKISDNQGTRKANYNVGQAQRKRIPMYDLEVET